MSSNDRLRRIVVPREPVLRGGVVGVQENSIYVSSSAGLKEFQVSSPSSYKVGDGVKFQGNNFLGRLPSDAASKVIVV